MGGFDARRYRMWSVCDWPGAHDISPGGLGCPWKGGGARLLPKGAAGISPRKPTHDDNNGVISLSFWTSMTAPSKDTYLVFYINGQRVFLSVLALRWVLFMGHVPHETCTTHPETGEVAEGPDEPRLHHSGFAKPEVEHLAAHVLSNLPCARDDTGQWPDWTLGAAHRVRVDAFSMANMQPFFRSPAQDSAETKAAAAAAAAEDESPSTFLDSDDYLSDEDDD